MILITENLQGNFLFLQIKDVLERRLRLCSINVTFLSFEEFSSAVQVRNIFQNITRKCFYCMSFLGWFNKLPLVAWPKINFISFLLEFFFYIKVVFFFNISCRYLLNKNQDILENPLHSPPSLIRRR